MAEVIRMPRMSDTMEEGNIVAWLKNVGDKVEPGDVLAEVETDKATMELESYHEGVLLHIGIEEGPVPVNGILAVIGEEGEDFQLLLKEATTTLAAETKEQEESTQNPSETTPVQARSDSVSIPMAESTQISDRKIKASPLAKSMASEKGIELSIIKGTGDGGRIIKRDVEEHASKSPASAIPSSAPALLEEFEYGNFPISQMRKTIARRLSESKFSSPHFYLTMEINMDNIVIARKDINAVSETRISFNDFVVKACAAALRQHPKVNASWLNDSIAYHKEINIGVAVAIDEGLVVPVLRNTDLMSLTTINRNVKDLARRARDRRLSLEEMQSNTFTISNLGMFGIEEFTAIINPPDACILAVGAIIQKAIVKDGQIIAANMMKVTLSCDHRIVDGATGSEFLQKVKSYLENPIRILL